MRFSGDDVLIFYPARERACCKNRLFHFDRQVSYAHMHRRRMILQFAVLSIHKRDERKGDFLGMGFFSNSFYQAQEGEQAEDGNDGTGYPVNPEQPGGGKFCAQQAEATGEEAPPEG